MTFYIREESSEPVFLETGVIIKYDIREKLMEYMTEGRRGVGLCVSVAARLDDIYVSLKMGDEEKDIFALPVHGDDATLDIFHHLIRHF